MDTSYYNRVTYKSQPAIGTFFSVLARNPQQALKLLALITNDRVRDVHRLRVEDSALGYAQITSRIFLMNSPTVR